MAVVGDAQRVGVEVEVRLAERLCAVAVEGLVPDEVALRDVDAVWTSFDRIERLGAAGRGVVVETEVCERGSSRFVELDHRDPWATTHHTTIDEIDPLCKHDHNLKTHHGRLLVECKGRRAFVPPGHPYHPRTRPPP
jgi:hypothetical protein